MEMAIGKFKAHCLQALRDVQERCEEIVVTKRGKPIARVVPIENECASPAFGCMKGTGTITGDIISPIAVKWNANE